MFFANTPIDSITGAEVRTLIDELINADKFNYIVTPNVDHVVRNYRDREAINYTEARLSLCDSKILFLLAKLLAIHIDEVLTGSDLTEWLIKYISTNNYQVTIIGSKEELISKIKIGFGLNHINHYNPPMGFIDNEYEVIKCIEFVIQNPAEIILFAVGSPQQEILANRISKSQEAKGLGFCVGASLLFLGGEEKRAPQILRDMHLEWAYRLLQNPKRLWKRYLVEDIFIFFIFIKLMFKKVFYNY